MRHNIWIRGPYLFLEVPTNGTICEVNRTCLLQHKFYSRIRNGLCHLLHKLQTMAKHKPKYCNFSLSTENETIRNLRDQDLFNTLKISCNLFFLFSIEKVEASILKYAIPCIQTQFIFLYKGRISDGPILQVSTLELIINILIHHTSQSIHNADEQSTIYHL